MDADFSLDPRDIPKLLEKKDQIISSSDLDFVRVQKVIIKD